MQQTEFGWLTSRSSDPIFWTPERLGRPSAWWGHVPFAFWLTAQCKPRLLVELGTHCGVSYAAFCETVLRLGLATRCFAVDTWLGDAQAGRYGEEVYADLAEFHQQRYGAFSRLLRQTFDEARGDFADATIDLLHIDGYHTYEAVRHDFDAWRPKLSERAIVLFHDTNERRDDFGVWRLFHELKRDAPSFEFLHCHGLGVIALGGGAPEAIKALCALGADDEIAATRERFSQLGARWMELDAARDEMAASAERERRLQEAIADRDAQVLRAQSELARAKKNVDGLTRQITELEGIIVDRSADVDRAGRDLAKIQAQCEELASRAQRLETEKREAAERRDALANEAKRQRENQVRLLATLKRPDYDGRLPVKLTGLRHWIPGRRRKLRQRVREYRLIAASPLFDPDWYLANNPDVAAAKLDPVYHYLRYGAREGRALGPYFSGQAYKQANPDVAVAGENPLLHFIRVGASEGRSPGHAWCENRVLFGRDPASLGRAAFDDGMRMASARPEPVAENCGRIPRPGTLLRITASTAGFVQSLLTAVRGRASDKAPSKRSGRAGIPESARAIDIDYSLAIPFSLAVKQNTVPRRIAAIVHIYYEELAVEFRSYLRNIPAEVDVYISTTDAHKKSLIEKAFTGWTSGRVEVRVAPNWGRDIAPKLLSFRDVYDRYEFVIHLHSKCSDHASALVHWRHYLLESLVGSAPTASCIFEVFEQNPRLGMIAAQHFEPVRHWINWGNNFDNANRLAHRMGFSINPGEVLDFPSGSMFWARSAALRPLLDLDVSEEEFENENSQTDGTLAHAIERLYFYVCEKAGFDWIKVTRPELMADTPAIISVRDASELNWFVHHHVFRVLDPQGAVPRTAPPPGVEKCAETLPNSVRDHFLGTGRAIVPNTRVAIGLVTYDSDASWLSRATEAALLSMRFAGLPADRCLWVLDNGSSSENVIVENASVVRLPSRGNVGFGAGHNRLMRAAFADGAAIYMAINPNGALHPEAVQELVRMMQAHDNRALVEASQFPLENPKPYDPVSFETPWVSGTCLAIPRVAFEELDGFDESFFMYCEDVDLSWRARASGFALKTCPTAFFLHAVADRDVSPQTQCMIFTSGVLLARKWGAPEFEAWLKSELATLDRPLPSAYPTPVPDWWRNYADFTHGFTFAQPRW